MPKIITVTFNPALDKSISMANLVPDKKLKCSQPVYEPGGGGINVARAIHNNFLFYPDIINTGTRL